MEGRDKRGNALVDLSNRMADAVEKVQRSVVRVNGRRRWPSSGLAYAEDLVLTSSHALEREEDLSVETHDGKTLSAQFVGCDPASDLAVLKAEGLNADAAVAAKEPARVGQLVLTVGRFSSEGPRASFGIVSAVGSSRGGRRWSRRGRGTVPEQYIQMDANPYPGLAGAPLIDAEGSVLGVVTTGLRGATFAVPAEIAWRTAQRLAERGSTRRGYLGILSQPVRLPDGRRTGLTQKGGLLIVRVEDGSPAELGGVIVGDILATLDGQPVEDTDDLLVLLGDDRVGKALPVGVVRGGELKKLEVTIGERG